MTSGGWSVSLAMTVGTTVTLTATANQPLDGTGQWLEIFDMSSTGTMNYLNYCNTGTTCTSTTVPAETQSTYIAVVGNTITNSYAEYAPSSASAWSNQVTPPAWTITLTADITTSIGLTATSNYAATGTTYLEIFDTAKPQTGGITYLNYCNSGTTCSATTVPQEKGASYTAVVTHGPTNTYPPSSIIATSSPVTPPPWTVILTASGSTVTATTNYAAGYNVYVEIFDISKPQTYITYIKFCSSGAVCTGTTSSPSHQFIATVGSISNYFPPSSIIALSNQVSTSGPTAPYETAGGSNPSELNQCFQCKGDPVNTSNGEFFENVTDIAVPGRGPGLALSRAYSSQLAPFDGPLGFGWTFNYNMTLVVNSSGTVDVHQENGSMVTFTPDANGAYHAPARVLAALVHNADGTWTYTRRTKDVFTFASGGQLAQLSDLNGNTTTLPRNGSGQITTATDGSGRTLTFAYNAAGRIATITDPVGQVSSYQYDTAGRLTSQTAPGGAVTAYGYDASNLMTSVTDPRGSVTVNNYDQAQRVIKQTTAAGDLLLSYGVDGSDGQTTITSPGGRITKETYRSGQLIKKILGAGSTQQATWTYAYDQNTFGITSVTDPLGYISTATYDGAGNRLTATDPANHQQSWTYNALNEVLTATDPAGTTTTYAYDTSGNPLGVSTPLTGTSQTATTTYGHADTAHPGDITTITDPNGHTTTLTHTGTGALASSTDPLGNATSFTYDVLGRRLTTVSPRGNTTTNAYDTAGHLSTVTDPLSHTTTYAYDADGNRTAVTDANGHTTVTAYDALNRPTTVTSPDTTATTTAYDPDGNKTGQTDALGHATSYAYDALNRLTSSTDPLNRTTSYAYDSVGHPVTVTDPAGRTTTNTYDNAGNRTGTSYSDGVTPNATFTYTATGKRATTVDGTGTTTNSYDSLGRLTGTTNGAGQATGYTYDLDGHLTALAYPNGQTVTRAYDNAGHLTGITDWLGHTTAFTPDADGNKTSTVYGNGVTAATSFDTAGQVSSITDTGPGNTSLASFSYTRNPIGALASSAITGITQPAEAYSYTSRDQLASVNTGSYGYDSAGNTTALATGATLSYDVASQPTSYTLSGTTTAITYDTQGNRLTGPASAGATATYTWDQANRLTAANGTSYAYNADGLRSTRTPATGTAQHYAWDNRAGVPLILTDGTTSYLYDDAGNPIEHIDGTGAALYYQHDQYGSTRLLTDAAGATAATYTYDANGNLTTKTGTADTPLRWNGQTQDTDTGLYYLRARYYDPATSQFFSVDPLASITQDPYVFANNNPLNRQDPSGQASSGFCGVGMAGFIMGVMGQVCIVVAVDDRNGNVTFGTTETFGGGMQTPALVADLSSQFSTARSVDQLSGVFGYGGITAADVVDTGVGVFGGKCSDAPGGMVLGGDYNLGVGVSPVAEVHMGASNTSTQTLLSFNPLKWFK
jgi:RHS repeat-associated protein